MSPLAVYRQPFSMPKAAIAAQIHQPLDVLLNLTTKVSLDLVARLDDVADRLHIGFREFVDLAAFGDLGLLTDRLRGRTPDSKDVRQGVCDGLAPWEIDSRYACHRKKLLALTLLVAGILTDHPNDASTADDLALLTDLFHARTNLHESSRYSFLVIWPRVGSFRKMRTKTLSPGSSL